MIKHIYIFVLAMMLLASSGVAKAQDVALKTNLLGWATTSLNAGVEVGIAEKQTAQLFATLNPWEFSGGKKVRIWNVEPEYRWWTCQRFGGSFFGVHALAGTYGYQWLLSRHWNMEASFGVGYAYSPYKLYGRCARCLEKNHRNYVGPTKAALSMIYIF